jgi:hypothetical protein
LLCDRAGAGTATAAIARTARAAGMNLFGFKDNVTAEPRSMG